MSKAITDYMLCLNLASDNATVDSVKWSIQVQDSEDTDLKKSSWGLISSVDNARTLTQILADVKAAADTAEGL